MAPSHSPGPPFPFHGFADGVEVRFCFDTTTRPDIHIPVPRHANVGTVSLGRVDLRGETVGQGRVGAWPVTDEQPMSLASAE